jgi:hypothetical protein
MLPMDTTKIVDEPVGSPCPAIHLQLLTNVSFPYFGIYCPHPISHRDMFFYEYALLVTADGSKESSHLTLPIRGLPHYFQKWTTEVVRWKTPINVSTTPLMPTEKTGLQWEKSEPSPREVET